ncbi:2-keto-4-pentenoate hydratase/2-oxohepta-3-ene-1,7-dioic acid hydratase (catechol pathway) [Paenibacillus sp. UNCCL117]|uniref:fumarylacetoacetate hydrolase family protein n=1 Tax=unclassified Paenibacillus TaxID=185978 RepID=UPI000886FA17|nr:MULTISPECIES: fumarylacetoacetate hydrolase family protein [unclassified Paenibacillus]SDD62947.1 2-keto-4-pentenoate hydratase/2-oxohepta-3-ene-1,7-dioic acid hydratase (catechol pathway) [Paenibacillus sp. cl123]SFW67713.1 2-keto-4-pentenoate hydratase/2-oxohepta-3-ene-1,7-dioic acid hydratase (catechol pathway) [Paenibacillus sp. UNCCL117]
MKLLTFFKGVKLHFGVHTREGVLDVTSALSTASGDNSVPQTIMEAIAGGAEALDNLDQLVERIVAGADHSPLLLDEAELTLGPCVTHPSKIICVGLNYRKHAEESQMAVPQYPILFNKFNNTLAGHGADVALPKVSSKVDYEAELAIVIGKTAKYVPKEAALEHVFGYCCVNDLSARDLQMRTNQWLLGKSCDGFSPLGPYLVTADEVGNPNDLSIRSIVNGELRQNSNTSDMIFYCDEIVSYISQHMTLLPGDIILTGTPEGVVLGYPEEKQVWLKDGDTVTVEIEKLGSLTNRMVAEA